MVDAMNGNSALAAIGRDIVALGDGVLIPASSEVQILVGGTGGEGVLRVYDASGKEVGTRPLGTLVDGRQSVELGDAIEGLPDGEYTYAVEVSDGSGNKVPTQTFVTGRVDGVRYGSNGPVLTSGPFEIPIGSIVEIVVGG
jgi:flagellar hook assembly protein FlgD